LKKITVLIVDDSKLVREILCEILSLYNDIEVVAQAEDAYAARELIKRYSPDVITLDVEMPKMDGVTFLKNLMRLRPMPVVMLSTLTTKGADVTLEALEVGAVDFIAKPRSSDLMGNLQEFNDSLYEKIKFAASVDMTHLATSNKPKTVKASLKGLPLKHEIIALGASTGGTEALRLVMSAMPNDVPPIVITQHIPQSFSQRFAKRLNANSVLTVLEAKSGLELQRGHVYVAPGHLHLKIIELNGKYVCQLDDSATVNRHKPSVDVMFDSLVKLPRVKVFAGLLTGMGDDGAQGLLRLKQQRHFTFIQDKASSMVWGMPGVAASFDAHCVELSLSQITQTLIEKVHESANLVTQ